MKQNCLSKKRYQVRIIPSSGYIDQNALVIDTSLVTMSLTEECTLNEFVIQAWCVH